MVRVESLVNQGGLVPQTSGTPSTNGSIYLPPHATSLGQQEHTNRSGMNSGEVVSTPISARSGPQMQPDLDSSQLLQNWPTHPNSNLANSQWKDLLPTYDEAAQLLDFYAHNVCWTYHFVHVPTLRRHLQKTYQELHTDIYPDPSVLALLCAVFALARYFAHQQMEAQTSNAGPEEFSYKEYVALTSRALREARHLDNPSVESIQAVMLLASSLLLNIGATTAFRVLLSAMFMSAQALRIHQIDSPKNQRLREHTDYDRLDHEIKRRLWWHIASSDWIYAFMLDTETETYVVQAHRMHVNLPSNTDDAAISSAHCVDEPLSVPTEMTYYLFRCRLSILCREFLDHAADKGLSLEEMEYEDILAFDRKINAFIESVPYFLRMDPESQQRCVILNQQRPYLVWQRFMAQFGAATRMSGLHRPYIALGARDPKYAYSRMVCLKAARTVLETEKQMNIHSQGVKNSVLMDPRKVSAMMHQMTFAIMVLIMDLHFNKDEPQAEERAQEISECLKRLDEARSVSAVAAKGLEKLEGVLRRWGLLAEANPPWDDAVNQTNSDVSGISPMSDEAVGGGTVLVDPGHYMESGGDGFQVSSWMDTWHFDAELDSDQWKELFQDLESISNII